MKFTSSATPYKYSKAGSGKQITDLWDGYPWDLEEIDELNGFVELRPALDGTWLAVNWDKAWGIFTVFMEEA